MKRRGIVSVLAMMAVLLSLGWFSVYGEASKNSVANSPEAAEPFLGRWDLTLKAPDREYPSWLELKQEDGQLKAEFVSRWGNARPLPKAEIVNGQVKFVSPKEDEARRDDMVFVGKLVGTTLSGTTTGPKGEEWTWTGVKAPALKRATPPQWGSPMPLFNNKDLRGWHVDKPSSTKTWTVQNGSLISPGEGPELINDSKFEDFKLHVEFNCGPNSNSGVYLRGRYELQIETDSAKEPPTQRMGGVYGFLVPSPEPPRRPGEWQTFDITLVGRMLTVVQNGQSTINNQEIPGITGGALDSHEGLPGPIYLQGTEKGHVAFRSIILTPAKQ